PRGAGARLCLNETARGRATTGPTAAEGAVAGADAATGGAQAGSAGSVGGEGRAARRRSAGARPPARPTGRRGAPNLAALADDGTGVLTPVRLARCCLPLPGDAVVGLTTHGSSVSLHRQECVNAAEVGAERERLAVVAWSAPDVEIFPVEIAVEAFDRYGLLADITEVLSETSVAVRAASTATSDDRVAHARFTIEVTGTGQLDAVLAVVRGVGGVYDCFRACPTQSQAPGGDPRSVGAARESAPVVPGSAEPVGDRSGSIAR
ncbi:ACT domain-containing protein, partial [Frankia sp. AgB32]|uniref:ACT domain-containing protein n=1 Tax=Frankia sp. AgB32 TaxID=631119 RepID=UPI00200C3830